MGFKLHFFFRVKEVFLFQLPKYSPLGLGRRHKGSETGRQWSRGPTPEGDDVLMSSSIETTALSEEPPDAVTSAP